MGQVQAPNWSRAQVGIPQGVVFVPSVPREHCLSKYPLLFLLIILFLYLSRKREQEEQKEQEQND